MSDFFLADDLSGALEAAAAFHRAGRRVRIVLSHEAWDQAAPDELIGFTTETRNSAPELAARAVVKAVAHGLTRGGRLRFKKIDSTLRGPVAAELHALAAALPDTRILFTPANPAAGRTVRGGVLLVRGVPVAETEFARDPVSPVTESGIARLLGAANSDRVIIADAETEEELAAAVARIAGQRGNWVAVGSGALARPVASWAAGGRSETRREKPAASGALSPVLLVCGSAHPANRAQAERLARVRGVKIFEVAVQSGVPWATQQATAELRAGRSAALVLERAPAPGGTGSAAALRAISQAATATIAASAGAVRLFVTGGETAHAIVAGLGVSSLEVRAEIEAGVALAAATIPPGRVLWLAVKPGGFGDEETWVRVYETLAVN